MSESIIKCEGLNKWYGSIQALKDVSIDIKKGEAVGLVGDNGAGKSTFIKILSGVHQADSGNIYFDGNLVKINDAKDSMKLGIETIYQDSALAPTLSIARNLFVGREPLTFKLGSLGLLDREKMAKESLEVHFDGKSIVMNDYKELSGFGLKIKTIKSASSEKGQFEELIELHDTLTGKSKQWPISLDSLIETTEVSFIANDAEKK